LTPSMIPKWRHYWRGRDMVNAHGAVEERLAARCESLERLVEDLVGINSQIPPHGDEREIAAFLQGVAVGLGLPEPQILARDPDRPNVIIRIPGEGGGPALALNGHIDTKPVGDAADQWRTDPFVATRVDDRMYGLGVSDMKGAVACMLHAAAAIRDAGVRLRGDLVLTFVADEEAGAFYGSRYVAPLLKHEIDACLIGEPSGWTRDWEGLHVISRGICCFEVHVRGTQMHSSLSDRMPSVNSNMEMARLMLGMRDQLAMVPLRHSIGDLHPTLNVGVLARGGVFYGVVPGESMFACDLRTLPGMSEDDVVGLLDTWAAEQSAPEGFPTVRVLFDPVLKWIAPSEIPILHPLVRAAQDAVDAVLADPPAPSMFPGTTDAPWFSEEGIPTIPSLGPGILTYCHGPNEFVTVESLHQAARIYARTAMSFCQVATA